ncbi:MAG: ATP-dependent Clp protease ATP-binding subunit [Lachnospiraceae bacterium]|nr:ATP-dependent Clp protease ATP-binding subunit [Lachnospiraceae bacterium]
MELNEQCKEVLKYANQIGKNLGASAVDTQHLLYGLAKCKDSLASSILASHGITVAQIKKSFETRSEALRKVSVKGKLELTPQVKKILDISERIAQDTNSAYVGTEHILYAIVTEGKCLAYNLLGYLLKDSGTPISKIADEIMLNFGFDDDNFVPDEYVHADEMGVGENTSRFSLEDYTKDITEMAMAGELDPVIGRNDEIMRIIQVLARRSKNNPCLVGQPGVGKTAIVEGLAQRIADGNVPDIIKDKRILSLDMSSLVAGTQYRGEFEKRLKAVVEEVSEDGNIVLFMDEIHTLIGAGGAKGTLDASNILKPALSRGEIQLIGATTEEEFRKYFEKDAALERRFQPIAVTEPSPEDTLKILFGIKDKYEEHHNVYYDDDAIELCVTLSQRYITDRNLPDKAIDVMDEAAALIALDGYKKSDKISSLRAQISECDKVMKESIENGEFEKAGEAKSEQDVLFETLRKAEANERRKIKKDRKRVTTTQIEAVISRWSKVPVSELSRKESERLMNLEKNLHKRIIGQKEAVEAVSKAIRRGRVGLSDPKRPIGSFVFLGPTGVGKTELSKALAEAVFGSEDSLIRVDMSEYMEAHSVSKILGSPPGYVGFDEGGQLSERVRKNPYSVVLFDEIEKAHPDVFNVLLQILDDGQVTDSQGRKVNFKNTIIIMTSNVGAKRITEPKNLGFGSKESKEQNYEKMKNNVMEEVKQLFKPEFINRIDDFIVFHKLDRKELEDICALLLSNLAKRAKEQLDIDIKFTNALKLHIVDKYSNPLMGARPLRRGVMQEIEDPLAGEILSGRIEEGNSVKISYRNEKVIFN